MKKFIGFFSLCLIAFVANAQTSVVTFNVDFNYTGFPNADFDAATVNGNWNGWGAWGAPLEDLDGDNIWTGSIELNEGAAIEYVVAGSGPADGYGGWGTVWNAAGLDCALPGTNNWHFTVGADDMTINMCPLGCDETCADPGPPAETADVTFRVDMNDYPLSFGFVNLSGSLNGWCGDCAQMSDGDGDGVYELTVSLDQGSTYEYKFTMDNWSVQEQFQDGEACTSTIDGYVNRTLTVGTENTTLDLVCFDSCEECTGVVAENIMVTWQVDMSVVGANPAGVFIAGGFQGWDGGASQMTDAGNGVYTYTQEVLANSYLEWKYLNGPGWGYEETVPGACANSSTNRNYQAGTEDVTIDLVCFAECVACDVEVVEYAVTFNVNMANEEVAETGVYLAGGGNFGNPGDNEMTDPDGDGIYSITMMLDEGFSSYYTFTNGACGDWSCKENLAGQPCGDPANYNDRFLPAITGETEISTCFGQCSTDGTCESVSEASVTFRLDMNTEAVGGDVTIFGGTLNGWGFPGEVMSDEDGDGIYEYTTTLPAGGHEYKFVNTGTAETLDSLDAACTLTTGDFTNRIVYVEGGVDMVLDAVCWETCEACDINEGDVYGCTDANANNYNSEANVDDGSCSYTTTFNVDMTCAGVDFTTVHITGPYFGWGVDLILSDDDADGTYSITLDVPGPTFEYKYMVDYWAHQEDLIDDMQDGASCAPVTDYSSYANRLVDSGSTTADTYGTCLTCDEVNPPVYVDIAIAIDMNYTGFPNADYDNIVVNGSWNGWAGWGVTLADADADGVFTGTLTLEEGTEFEFVIAATGAADGWSGWGSVFNAPEECSTNPELPIGAGGGNYGATATEGATIEYCAGSCAATCPLPGCTDPFYAEFDMNATEDDGSCATPVVFGCIYEAADNYDAAANTDDGSCEFTLNACPGDLDGDGLVATPDLLQFLSVFGTDCE